MPSVTDMPTDTLPLAPPLRRRPARRLARRLAAARTAVSGRPSVTRPAVSGRPSVTRPAATAADAAGTARPDATRPAATRPDHSSAAGSAVVPRRARLVALGVGGFLLPWCVVLGMTLPATAQAQHWPAAWVGLDAGEAIAALATAVLLARADARAALTAAAGGALLLTDAWFDVCTSGPGLDHAVALAEAAFVELPLAGAAFWLAVRLTRGRAAP